MIAATRQPRPARPKVIVTRRLMPVTEARLNELFDVVLNESDSAFSRNQLADAMQRCDVLVPTLTDGLDASLISGAGERLRMIANFGAGVDHIDLPATYARGIIVTNTPGVLSEDTADMTMALILAVPRRLAEGVRRISSGGWAGWSPSAMLGHRVAGKTLGIVGFGRIGEAVARRARTFGLNVLYHKRHRLPPSIEDDMGVVFEPDLDRLMSRADIITVHCPLTAQTTGLIDARRIGMMKRESYLINTARGEIVDEEALISALEQGRIGGAGLDVFQHEPQVAPRLVALGNVILTPHMGSATFEGRAAMGDLVITNIRVWSDGHRPPDQVLEGWNTVVTA